MSLNQPMQQQPIKQLHDEMILVVKREMLFPHGAWHGIKHVDMPEYLTLIQHHKEFHPRSIMETDTRYKQIIPYMVFEYNNNYFLMQRKAKASETRLHSKFTLGIGGHVREEDVMGHSLFDWARREFYEEIDYAGTLAIEPLGILNDDSNAVGQVHIGLVLLLKGDSPHIHVKEELESGQLVSLQSCQEHKDRLESWSQLVLAVLEKQL